MSESSKTAPDNVIVMDVNGTKMIIREFFGSENLNEIITNRIKRDSDPDIPSDEGV